MCAVAGYFLIYALSFRLPRSMNKIKNKNKKPIGIDGIAVELTRRVNDFKMVYLARNTKKWESAMTVDNSDGEDEGCEVT